MTSRPASCCIAHRLVDRLVLDLLERRRVQFAALHLLARGQERGGAKEAADDIGVVCGHGIGLVKLTIENLRNLILVGEVAGVPMTAGGGPPILTPSPSAAAAG